MKSGNYELSQRGQHTHKFNAKKGAQAFWDAMSAESSSTFDYHSRRFKPCRVVKATYRMSQTYFNSFVEFYTAIR